MKNPIFQAGEILLPKTDDMSKWAVVACDQYSSQPEYWMMVEELIEDAPSTLHFVLPEAWLETEKGEAHKKQIAANMEKCLEEDFFVEYPEALIYTERTLNSGKIRRGLVGLLDLEAYDYLSGSKSEIRATEATILERIPARVSIREMAPVEFPHILLLADDADDILLHDIETAKDSMQVLYDFDLMAGGGHITGRLLSDELKENFYRNLKQYSESIEDRYPGYDESTLTFVVGDGNHSLAAAKTIWESIRPTLSEEERRNHPARFALAELGNIHDESLEFEPIHRIITHTDPERLLHDLKTVSRKEESEFPVVWHMKEQSGILYLDPDKGELAVAILQNFLDQWLQEHPGQIDYIHGDEDVIDLARQENSIGFLLPSISKASLFKGVIADGSLPRKTFSMGHANEKRFYIEGKKIR